MCAFPFPTPSVCKIRTRSVDARCTPAVQVHFVFFLAKDDREQLFGSVQLIPELRTNTVDR